ncbi:MAG: hypothetical protein J0G95_00860 [Rhizobiales bacterium]|nr:hypothetical protein [Hyphomicrobiales bacterium]
MAGLDPAIHALLSIYREDVDARDKPGHDDIAMADGHQGQSLILRSALRSQVYAGSACYGARLEGWAVSRMLRSAQRAFTRVSNALWVRC